MLSEHIIGGGSELLVEEKTLADNITVSSTSTTDQSVSIAKSGYTPLGVIGFSVVNASSSGTASNNAATAFCYLDGSTCKMRVRNVGTATMKVKLGVQILYKKD